LMMPVIGVVVAATPESRERILGLEE
jgi:hypothetical protein